MLINLKYNIDFYKWGFLIGKCHYHFFNKSSWGIQFKRFRITVTPNILFTVVRALFFVLSILLDNSMVIVPLDLETQYILRLNAPNPIKQSKQWPHNLLEVLKFVEKHCLYIYLQKFKLQPPPPPINYFINLNRFYGFYPTK